MVYGTKTKVKERLNIDSGITAVDTALDSYIAEADGYINTQLELHATVPVASPDDELIGLANALAAGLYRYNTEIAHSYKSIENIRKDIQYYIQANYGKKNASGLTDENSFLSSTATTGLETN